MRLGVTDTAPGYGCYWERLSGLGGSLSEIIANDFIGFNSAQAIVDIASSDLAFSTDADCRTWFSTPVVGFQASIPPGTWLVGNQVAPGTYQANANYGCCWERDRNFSGSLSGIIANNFVASAGRQLVSIAASDAGFNTDGDCGVSTRLCYNSLVGPLFVETPEQSSDDMERQWVMHRSKSSRLRASSR